MKGEILQALRAARAAARPAVLLTDLATGAQAVLESGAVSCGDLPVGGALVSAADEALRRDASTVVDAAGQRTYIGVFNPPRRLAVVGAVHIAQPLVAIVEQLDYRITLIDPRDAWATDERFPGVSLDRRWPGEALADLAPDARTAVVALTHDPKLDEPALAVALRSPCFYIGALGSRRTHARRLERLREEGFDDAQLARIRGPVGLDIGAVSPAEIALSIAAELTQELRTTARDT